MRVRAREGARIAAREDEDGGARRGADLGEEEKKTFFTRTNEKTTPNEDEDEDERRIPATDSVLQVGSSKTHHQIAVSLRHLRDFERALDHFGAIAKPLEAALGAGDVLCEMESCFRELGLGEEAESCLRRAASEAPAVRADNVAKIATFRRERMGGDATTCVEELERCLALAAAAAKIERQSEKTAKTAKAAKVSSAKGTHPFAEDAEDVDHAITGLDRRREARVRVLLGQALGAVGQAEKAEKQLGAACAKAPEDPGTWLALAAFYRGTERDDLAMPALRKVAALGEVPRDFEAEAREEAHRKANAPKRELSMRGGNRRALSLRERASGADADPSESFLASSSPLRVLNPKRAGGFVRTSRAPRSVRSWMRSARSRRRSSGCRK